MHKNLIKKKFQSAHPDCIDITLTKVNKNSKVLKVEISDHHSFIVTPLKSQLIKSKKNKVLS